MDQTFYFQLVTWIVSGSTLLISSALVISFLRLKRKAFGLYMILILNLTAILFSLISILGLVLETNQLTAVIFGSLQITLYNFALYWSTSIAILVYTIVKYKRGLDSKKWMAYGVGGCAAFALAIMIATIFNLWGVELYFFSPGLFGMNQPSNNVFYQVMYLLTYDFIGTLLPIMVTFYCYLYVFRSIRATYGTSMKSSHVDASRVLWYSGIQMICFIPATVLDILGMFVEFDCFGLALVVFLLHRSWGFLNALAYWFLRPNRSERGNSLVSDTSAGQNSFASQVVEV